MAILATYIKQPADVLDYDIDADGWLPTDDLIISAVTTSTTGITVNSTTIINDGRTVKVWLQGGANGVTYKVEVTMTTDDGRVKQVEFRIKVKEY